MNSSTIIGLVNNAALLLSLGLLYDILKTKPNIRATIVNDILIGVISGFIGIAIMLNSWDFGHGVVFDTRSVLLCISGYFFGAVPALMVMLMTAAFRLFQGGAGAWTGVAVIMTSGGIALVWRQIQRNSKKEYPSAGEIYIVGIIVHVVMLAWMLTLPRDIAIRVLSAISLPVMIIFPLTTAALGMLIVNREKRQKAKEALRESEEKFRSLFMRHSAVMMIIDPETGEISDANEAAENFYGWPIEQLKKKKIQDINILPTAEVKAELDKARSLKRTHFEFRHRLADGSIRDVEVYSGKIVVKGKDFLYSIIQDISDRKAAEEALRESERILNATQRLAKTGGWEWEVDKQTMKWTDETYRIHDFDTTQLGYSTSAYIDKSIECYDPDDRSLIMAAFRRCVEYGEPYDLECPFTTGKGRRLWIRTTAEAVWEDGRVVRVAGNIMDITERKQSEEKLRQSHDLLSNLARLVPGVIYQFRLFPDGRSSFPYASPGINDIYEVSPEEVREDATPVYCRLHPDDYNNVVEAIRESAGTLKTFYCQFRVILPRKGLRWCLSQAHPERMPDGGALWHGIISDITERVMAEDALREKEQFQLAMIEASPLAIISLEIDGRVRSWNAAAENMFGWTEEEVIGKPLPIVAEDQQDAFAELRRRVINGEAISNVELTRRRRDGTAIEISLSTAPIREKESIITGIMSLVQDITQLKHDEKEREKLHAQFIQAQKMESIGRLAGGIAHDFNNMLNVIYGYSQLLLENMDEENPIRPDIEQILFAAKRSADITRQLLAFSRQQTITPAILDLNETVESMLKMLRRLIGEDVDLSWHPKANLWPVKMDTTQIDQVLVNICVNARDAIVNTGKITIETDMKAFDEEYCSIHMGYVPGDFVMLSVSDDGCGMDKETMQNLFEPFFTTKETGKGTGLGLATVYGIIKQNNGFINVYSEPGQGSVFKIYLPRHKSEAELISKNYVAEPDTQGSETILLVEDEMATLKMTTIMLRRLGYTVLTAKTPSEAIGIAHENENKVHLLMTDVIMPEMNGKELAEHLKSFYPSIKILFMSGYTSNVIVHRGVLDDGVNFIQKPFSKKDVAVKIREALQN